MIAVDRGLVGLDDPAGPPGSTVRHLLAHASGLAFDDATVVSPPARTRIYSNTGYDALAATVEAGAGRPFGVLVREWLLEPLGMTGARLVGPPSQGLVGTLRDLEALAFELLAPAAGGAAHGRRRRRRSPSPGCAASSPGSGCRTPTTGGSARRSATAKTPHWTGSGNSPRTFGHFGGSGTFVWIDPDAGLALVALTDRTFGAWAIEAWPRFSDAVLEAAR